jgi:hypothetical protein
MIQPSCGGSRLARLVADLALSCQAFTAGHAADHEIDTHEHAGAMEW